MSDKAISRLYGYRTMSEQSFDYMINHSRLYGYRTMSEQSFDTNFRSLGLSVTMVCVFLRVYRLMLSAFYPKY